MIEQRDDTSEGVHRDPGSKLHGESVPAIQWIVSGVAVLVVLASFGLIAYDGFVSRRGAPVLSVAVDSIRRSGNLHRVHFTASNDGGSAAADVQVSGVLEAVSSAPKVILLDYLPPGSHEAAVFVFAEDPRAAGLRVQVESWTEP